MSRSPGPLGRSVVPFDSSAARDAVEVAPRVWWVGHVVLDDDFQTHPYLIEAADHSVLVDPGSSLTIAETMRKVEQVIPRESIRTILLHHSDPDIADAVHYLGETLTRPDVTIVTEWRSKLLLRHLTPRFPLVTVEELGWRLPLGRDRMLEFLLTPYLHFPGAFVTYDASTAALLTSDLFGGFNNAHRLYAEGVDDFEDIRRFHEHYMPSREILMSGLAAIRSRFPHLSILLPQHGYVIDEPLIDAVFDELFALECGVMLMSRSDTHLAHLIDVAAAIRRVQGVFDDEVALGPMIEQITHILETVLPISSLAVEWRTASGTVVRVDPDHPHGFEVDDRAEPDTWTFAISDDDGAWTRAVVRHADGADELPADVAAMLAMLAPHARTVVNRWRALDAVERERQALAHTATHDPLTGLPNRRALDPDRWYPERAAVLMIDVDRFKSINDRFGHPVGDDVLRRVAMVIASVVRASDVAVRYGGEEFLVVAPMANAADAGGRTLAERTRSRIANTDMADLLGGGAVTVSIGVTVHEPDEPLDIAIERADVALYAAKSNGRNRVEQFPAGTV